MQRPLDGIRREAVVAQEIWFVNRGLLVLRPKEPFIDWVRGLDPEHPPGASLIRAVTGAYLIPEFDGEEDAWEWIQANASDLLEIQLHEWYADESLWPPRRGWNLLRQWFELEYIELAWDLVDDELRSDPPAMGEGREP
jgi:hypothetical protein